MAIIATVTESPYQVIETPDSELKVTDIAPSALVEEGSHMEPTIGQIWPR